MKVDKIETILIAEKIECEGATLLSAEEAKELLTTEERKHYSCWWLRSPGNNSHLACYVSNYGRSNNYFGVGSTSVGVRPALIIKNHNLKIGDIFRIKDFEFKVISDTLAWMYKQDIGQHCFRENFKAEDANVYEKSDVKKFVDKWIKELTNEK